MLANRQQVVVCGLLVLVALVSAAQLGDAKLRRPVEQRNYCRVCRQLVSFAQEFNSSESRDENKELFRNYCELYYPASTDFQQGPCPLFVEGLFYALDHTDPIGHCDTIGVCNQTQKALSSIGKRPLVAGGGNSPRRAGVVCEFCEQIVEQVQATLTDPKTVATIRRNVNDFCEYLKAVDKDEQCKQMLSRNVDKIIEFVRQIEPLSYCKSIQLCAAGDVSRGQSELQSSRRTELPTLADFNNFGLETSVSIGAANERRKQSANEISQTSHLRGPYCTLCKTLVKEMFAFLRDNKTEANIVVGLNQVCKYIFPRNVEEQDECLSMVKAYTREIIQLLMDETDPQLICTLLDQCAFEQPASLAVAPKWQAGLGGAASDDAKAAFNVRDLIVALEPSVSKDSARICIECKIFIAYLRDSLENPNSQEAVKSWLKLNLCNNLPVELRDSCNKMVDQYADTLLKAIIGDAQPGEACAALGACKRKRLTTLVVDALAELAGQAKPEVAPAPQLKSGGPVCEQCVAVISSLDEYLQTHSIDKDVSVLIDQVCNKMPSAGARNTCVAVVETLGVQLTHAIAQMDNPQQLCASIMLCAQ